MQIQLKVWFYSAFQAVMLRVSVLDYSLTPETVEILTKGNTITLPRDLVMFFASNTYGAMRGILMAKLENSPVQLILPLMELIAEILPPFKVKLKNSL